MYHDGVVRIFVGLSCEPGCLISYLINYIIIYIKWNNFSPTRSVIMVMQSLAALCGVTYYMMSLVQGHPTSRD